MIADFDTLSAEKPEASRMPMPPHFSAALLFFSSSSLISSTFHCARLASLKLSSFLH